MTSALNNLFFLTKDPPVPTHHRAQIDLSNLVPFPLQKIFTPLPNIFWTLLSKMWPILYEKCPILTNHISYQSIFFRRKNLFYISWELFTFLKLGRRWEISLFCHISPELFIFLSFGIWCREYLPFRGNFTWVWFFMESFDISFIGSLEGI